MAPASSKPKLHPDTDPRAGELYGKHSHPRNRALDDGGVALVASTHREHLGLAGVDVGRLGDMEVLECGGTGRDALGWLSLGAGHVTHVDLSEDNVARLEAWKLERRITNLTVVHGDLLAVDLPKEHYDIVRSRGVLHHLADPALGLARYCAWTKPQGLVHFNVYRGGTFYYYGIKQIRALVRDGDLPLVEDALERLGVVADRAGILLDDFFVPYMHCASPARVAHDLRRLGLEVQWPRRDFAEFDHDLRYPDMPEKTEHLQYWVRRTMPVHDPVAASAGLCYHAGVDDIDLARGLPEAAPSLEAFDELAAASAAASDQQRVEWLISLYLTHHFELATVPMDAVERHRRLADAVTALLD